MPLGDEIILRNVSGMFELGMRPFMHGSLQPLLAQNARAGDNLPSPIFFQLSSRGVFGFFNPLTDTNSKFRTINKMCFAESRTALEYDNQQPVVTHVTNLTMQMESVRWLTMGMSLVTTSKPNLNPFNTVLSVHMFKPKQRLDALYTFRPIFD